MTSIRFGLVGAGAIAASCCNAVKSHPDARLAAVTDTNAERAQALAKAQGIPHVHATAQALFADATVDIVYIATPNAFHAPLALEALAAGKHVILEKPFAMNLAEARSVVAAARQHRRTFTLGMNQRFVDNHQRVRALVARGDLGRIYHVKTCWMRRAGIPKLGTWFSSRKLAGGGALLDIGVHALDLALFLSGNFAPVSVSGTVYTEFGNRGRGEGGWGRSERDPSIAFDVDDFATALVRFADGMSLTLDASWACHTDAGDRTGVQLFGTEAGAGSMPPRLFRQQTDGYAVVDLPRLDTAYPHNDRFHNVINHLLEREALCVTPEQALTVQAVLDGVYASCASGREVRIDTTI